MQHGGIIDVESEEELDKMLAEDPDSLTVLLASLTWCRPCKTLAKPLQARPPLELPPNGSTTERFHDTDSLTCCSPPSPGAAPARRSPSPCRHAPQDLSSREQLWCPDLVAPAHASMQVQAAGDRLTTPLVA